MTEVVIYHVYNKALGREFYLEPKPAAVQHANRVSLVLLYLARFLAVMGITILAINYAPLVTAWAGNGFSLAFNSNINLSSSEAQKITQVQDNLRSNYVPPYDPKLPLTNRLIIPRIGVKTDIQEATYDNYESALKQGVWRVSDFGAPSANSMPTILAAHRYGYLAW